MLKSFSLPGLAGRLDRLGGLGLFLSRVIIGYLWFTQLLWKLPPTFGCPSDFAVSTSLTARTSGLCDWTGLMAGTIVSIIPTVLLFAILGRKVINSIQFSGIK